ncbi:MAG: phosphatidate cytidylyltransferase [Solirubrobacterales bacterium]|nr:phosphatidate cytidylyltransferase [Solirubrobacterales bacterium]
MPPARRAGPQRSGAARSQRRGRSDLLARVLFAVPAALVAIVFIDIGGIAFALFLIAIGFLCLHELYRMLGRWRPLPLVGFVALAGMVIAARYGDLRAVLGATVVALPLAFVLMLLRGRRGSATVSIAGTMLGVFWIGLAFAHAELLRELNHGNAVLLDVLVGTFLGDTAAYVGGRLFGRRPLAPAISPNKTVEGLFCGMLVAIISVFLAGLYQDWMSHGVALGLGIAVAVLGPLGDLFESMVKREAGAKDAGSAFGAHGGALDRIDGVLFTAMAGYYIWAAAVH